MKLTCRGPECSGCPACCPPPWWANDYAEDPTPRDCVELPPWLRPEPTQSRPFDADPVEYPTQ